MSNPDAHVVVNNFRAEHVAMLEGQYVSLAHYLCTVGKHFMTDQHSSVLLLPPDVLGLLLPTPPLVWHGEWPSNWECSPCTSGRHQAVRDTETLKQTLLQLKYDGLGCS